MSAIVVLGVSRKSFVAPGPQQADDGLAIADIAAQGSLHCFRQRQPVHLDYLMPLVLAGDWSEVARQIEVDGFGKYAWRAQYAAQLLPPCGFAACLFDQLASGGFGRGLTGLQSTSWQFPHPALGGWAELPQQADAAGVIQRHDGSATRVLHYFVARGFAIGQQYLLHIDGDHPSLEYGLHLIHGLSSRSLAIV
jgi:hypothetical protein